WLTASEPGPAKVSLSTAMIAPPQALRVHQALAQALAPQRCVRVGGARHAGLGQAVQRLRDDRPSQLPGVAPQETLERLGAEPDQLDVGEGRAGGRADPRRQDGADLGLVGQEADLAEVAPRADVAEDPLARPLAPRDLHETDPHHVKAPRGRIVLADDELA